MSGLDDAADAARDIANPAVLADRIRRLESDTRNLQADQRTMKSALSSLRSRQVKCETDAQDLKRVFKRVEAIEREDRQTGEQLVRLAGALERLDGTLTRLEPLAGTLETLRLEQQATVTTVGHHSTLLKFISWGLAVVVTGVVVGVLVHWIVGA